jgi:hypothetical protein
MALDTDKAYDFVSTRVSDFYGSSVYNAAWDRYVARRDEWYCRPASTEPKWRSKLVLPTFWLGCQALHSQFVAGHQVQPFVFVKPNDDSRRDAQAKEKAALLHIDLNSDLMKSGFKERLLGTAYAYLERFGCVVGREYIVTKYTTEQRKKVVSGPYGIEMGSQTTTEQRVEESTCTDIIHPLNFAHDITRHRFADCEWASVRYELHVSMLYRFLELSKTDKTWNKEGIRTVLDAWERGQALRDTSTSRECFYSENAAGEDIDQSDMLVVNEYSGNITYRGNERDMTRYFGIYSDMFGVFLRIGPSPFNRHPYWKMSTHPDPDGPYGVGPCDMLLPVAKWERSTINQYNDYMNMAMRHMWKVYPDAITGGVATLLNGLPHGYIPIEDPKFWQTAVEPARTNLGTIPPVADVVNLIEKYKQQVGPSSNMRGKESGQLNDTATGIALMAQREDASTAALMAMCDIGIKDAMYLKAENMTRYFAEPVVAEIDRGAGPERIRHYVYELAGLDGYTMDIKRQRGDIEAGKAMNFLKLLSSLKNAVPNLPPKLIVDTAKDVGIAMGIDGIDEKFAELDASLNSLPPEIGGGAGGGPAAALGLTPVGPGGPAGGGIPRPPVMAPQPGSAGGANVAAAAALGA